MTSEGRKALVHIAKFLGNVESFVDGMARCSADLADMLDDESCVFFARRRQMRRLAAMERRRVALMQAVACLSRDMGEALAQCAAALERGGDG